MLRISFEHILNMSLTCGILCCPLRVEYCVVHYGQDIVLTLTNRILYCPLRPGYCTVPYGQNIGLSLTGGIMCCLLRVRYCTIPYGGILCCPLRAGYCAVPYGQDIVLLLKCCFNQCTHVKLTRTTCQRELRTSSVISLFTTSTWSASH